MDDRKRRAIDRMDKLAELASDGNLFSLLRVNDGVNEVGGMLLEQVRNEIMESMHRYFRLPTATIPFGATVEDKKSIAAAHPEVREFTYYPGTAPVDAVFQATRLLTVRRLLATLYGQTSVIANDPYTQAMYLSGVKPFEHGILQRVKVPVLDLSTDVMVRRGGPSYLVVDLTQSVFSRSQLSQMARDCGVVEEFYVLPYLGAMWHDDRGHCNEARYQFAWLYSGESFVTRKSRPLPPNFFSMTDYEDAVLLVLPYGSAQGYKFSRTDFVYLCGTVSVRDAYIEKRDVRNGFVVVSVIAFEGVEEMSDVPEEEEYESGPPGTVALEPRHAGVREEMLMPGLQKALAPTVKVFVPNSLYQRAITYMYTLKPGRSAISNMLRHLQAYSARLVSDGNIVTVTRMRDVEEIALLAEHVIGSFTKPKSKLAHITTVAKLGQQTTWVDLVRALVPWAVANIQSEQFSDGLESTLRMIGQAASGNAPLVQNPEAFSHIVTTGLPTYQFTEEKSRHVAVVDEIAGAMFGNAPNLPYRMERQELITVSRTVVDRDAAMKRWSLLPEVPVHAVQGIYDHIFPGLSMTDPTAAQRANELGDYKFVIDVSYFHMSLASLFEEPKAVPIVASRLRTEIGLDLDGSFRTLMGSLAKRNFNRPIVEAPGDRIEFAEQVFQVVKSFMRSGKDEILANYAVNQIDVSEDTIATYADKHATEEIKAAASLLQQYEKHPARYSLMPKSAAKPKLDSTARGAVAVGQTVVFHTKDLIALTVAIFVIMMHRLSACFETNVRFIFGQDEHTAGRWADEYLRRGLHVTEFDIPKFDKSQWWTCYAMMLCVMRHMGVSEQFIRYWSIATHDALAENHVFGLVFRTMFGNRSGSGGTLSTNCVVLLCAFLYTLNPMGIVAIIIKGDDSVVVSRNAYDASLGIQMALHWGFDLKVIDARGVTGFCSSFFVLDSHDKYALARDLLRLITKLGRSISLDRPARYFLDYYAGVVDAVLQYEDPVVVENMRVALQSRYQTHVDVQTLLGYLRHVASSSKNFLKCVYGFTDEQIQYVQPMDDALDTLFHSRNTRFTKPQELVDKYGHLRMPLVDSLFQTMDYYYDI